MRILSVCLLALLSSVAVARAAPAPFARSRDVQPPLSVDQVEQHLLAHHISAERIAPQGKRAEWIVVGTRQPAITWSYRPRGWTERVAYLVTFQGMDDHGQPKFTFLDLEQEQRSFRR